MFRIKICGITSLADARAAVAAGADAIGLNFYTPSPRRVAPEIAAEIVRGLPPGVCKVGLFVNHSLNEVAFRFDTLRLDLIQLHGDEPPDFVAALAPRPVLRVFRGLASGWPGVRADLAECARLGGVLAGWLIDACQPGAYGGTGQVADWNAVAPSQRGELNLPLVLAGGLRPDNVAEAIRLVRPDAVDTASGVESAPGVKDPARLAAFVSAARRAWE